jgi:hypothetical protein
VENSGRGRLGGDFGDRPGEVEADGGGSDGSGATAEKTDDDCQSAAYGTTNIWKLKNFHIPTIRPWETKGQ